MVTIFTMVSGAETEVISSVATITAGVGQVGADVGSNMMPI